MKDRPKEVGEMSELTFMVEATKQGLRTAKPYSDNYKWDMIADYNGNLNRVQIKSANKADESDRKIKRYKLTATDNSGKPYSQKDIEFIACHCIEDDVWYIIPVSVTKNITQICINLESPNASKFDKYRENWKLLKRRK